MAEQSDDLRRDLLAQIDARRMSIDTFLHGARPGGRRLANTAIVASAVSAVFTAGPALGGEGFTKSLAGVFGLASDLAVWRVACLVALLVSLVAAIATNLMKSQDTERKIAAAEATNAELEGLRTLVSFGQVSVGDGAKEYQQQITKIPFVEERHPPPTPVPAAYTGPPPGWSPPPGPPPGWNRGGRPTPQPVRRDSRPPA